MEESKKKMNTSKQRKAGSILSPNTATADISPYKDGKGMTTGKRDVENNKTFADKSPFQ